MCYCVQLGLHKHMVAPVCSVGASPGVRMPRGRGRTCTSSYCRWESREDCCGHRTCLRCDSLRVLHLYICARSVNAHADGKSFSVDWCDWLTDCTDFGVLIARGLLAAGCAVGWECCMCMKNAAKGSCIYQGMQRFVEIACGPGFSAHNWVKTYSAWRN